MRIVEAERVSIFPAGKPEPAREGSDNRPLPCTNKIRGITAELNGKISTFYIGHDQSASAWEEDLYHCAYIENSNGATTERVYGE